MIYRNLSMKQTFCNTNFSFDYEQGISYIEIQKDTLYKTYYFNQEYTGKVETDFMENIIFFENNGALIHLNGWMQEGIIKSINGSVQFKENTSMELKHLLSLVLQKVDYTLYWRPYGKFI